MAISSAFVPMLSLLVMLMTCTLHANGCYTSIISFGDSLADTGNLKESVYRSKSDPPHFLFLPYGETFFHEATGRCSNGRLIIDFVAESLGKLKISLSEKMMRTNNLKDIGQGVNFAVVGATALDSSFYQARGVYNPYTNSSLGVQLNWFKNILASICGPISAADCKSVLQNSLILMGEIGGNDYYHPIIAGIPIDEINSSVPLIINTITSAINDMIELGAKTLVVPGNLPIGCSTVYLSIFYGSDKEEYDSTTGCLTKLNKFAEYHNEMLQTALHQIRELHPDVIIIYADYYNAAMQFFRSPQQYGFTNGALKACCGGKGPYNYNLQVACGDPTSTTCDDPDTYANWDGLHLTEAAYLVIYKSLFQGTYTTPQYNSLCPTSTLQSREASSSLVQSS